MSRRHRLPRQYQSSPTSDGRFVLYISYDHDVFLLSEGVSGEGESGGRYLRDESLEEGQHHQTKSGADFE